MPDDAVASAATQFYGADAAAVLSEYSGGPDPVLGSIGAKWLTDTTFRCGAVITAGRHDARGAPVYSYQFEQPLPGREAQGAAHSYELPFVFGNLSTDGVLGGPFSDRDHALSALMTTYWTQFAKTGNPNGKGTPNWPRFDSRARAFVRFSTAFDGNVKQDARLRMNACRAFEKKVAGRTGADPT
jgi:para-nitrobenzyl esterase